ncbi:MAG: aldehyde dehydrogenase family protein, partial [Proteobacteria bacterium]|nr:aldehyde dehydrogenase family protein [Pseudomonadota bacterium]
MSLSDSKFISESKLLPELIQDTEFLNNSEISKNAEKIINACRQNKKERTKLDAFLSEYGLDNQEGVALMCLAESILRIPDSKTRDLIISERLSEGRWIEHLNKADSLFVNASTWGLLLAGKVVKTPLEWSQNPNKFLRSIVSKSGEFPIRNAVIAAMHILSQEFVMGRDFKDVNKIPGIEESIYSFDMLGEAARNQEQANIYYESYENAIIEVGKINLIKNKNNGVSIKISALCPSYEMRKYEDIKLNLVPKLIALTELGISKDVEITIDAEEQDRLGISFEIIKIMAESNKIKDWPGFGIALQAYGKRSLNAVEWVKDLINNRAPMHLRLVKGAYWDYEIKHAQVSGYHDYPVFTKKSITDLSYLACAFGMGELLYKCAEKVLDNKQPTSIYAPIGKYKDLLPYLVRRLLENGANSSFINRLLDPETDAAWLASGPHKKIENERKDIPLPCNIFSNRNNSRGIDISEMDNLETIRTEISKYKNKSIDAVSIYNNRNADGAKKHDVLSLANGNKIGTVTFDDPGHLKKSLETENSVNWAKLGVNERAKILVSISDDLESDPYQLIYYLMNEAGKTIQNAIDEIREAVD